ncbi:hypothetical protein GALMADRAFT_147160 [Galerina marginata CBS 339.88]|uniref:Uncharacterized protein n=1 Tax=Galerina marginata (strain CBS 339.88) TaxID=685588 RepID=A0A067SKT4_GALM3|nr:hypothetical protein GALMADRAFT_147160 [Galerina marginata CBS 339.88]
MFWAHTKSCEECQLKSSFAPKFDLPSSLPTADPGRRQTLADSKHLMPLPFKLNWCTIFALPPDRLLYVPFRRSIPYPPPPSLPVTTPPSLPVPTPPSLPVTTPPCLPIPTPPCTPPRLPPISPTLPVSTPPSPTRNHVAEPTHILYPYPRRRAYPCTPTPPCPV